MKHIILLIFCSSIVISAVAQDRIYKSDSSVLKVKILGNNSHEIWYRLFSDPDSLIHFINKYYVTKIVFENGHKRQVRKSLPKYDFIDEHVAEDNGRNFISVNMLDFIFDYITLSYEYTLRPGNCRIKFPLSIGLNHLTRGNGGFPYRPWNKTKIISTGVDFYWYPPRQGKIKYFAGPSVEFGSYNFKKDYTIDVLTGHYFSLFIVNGMLFQPLKNFNLSFHAGFGRTLSNSEANKQSGAGFAFGINAGVRF